MNSEDDTFRILSRAPYNEVYDLWNSPGLPMDRISSLEKLGWTYEEFYHEFYKRNPLLKMNYG